MDIVKNFVFTGCILFTVIVIVNEVILFPITNIFVIVIVNENHTASDQTQRISKYKNGRTKFGCQKAEAQT